MYNVHVTYVNPTEATPSNTVTDIPSKHAAARVAADKLQEIIGRVDPDGTNDDVELDYTSGTTEERLMCIFKIKGAEYCSIIAEPADGGITQEDRDQLHDFMMQKLTDKMLLTTVLGVISDIVITDDLNGDELSPAFTVGDVKAIAGWWKIRWLMQELCGMASARMMRMAAVQMFGWSDDDVSNNMMFIAQMAEESMVQDIRVSNYVVERATELYGDAVVDYEASKALKLKLLAFMHKNGFPLEDDLDYR